MLGRTTRFSSHAAYPDTGSDPPRPEAPIRATVHLLLLHAHVRGQSLMKTPLSSRKRSLGIRIAVEAALLLTAGALFITPLSCASKPTMEVQNAQVTHVGPFGIGMNVMIKVYNPNSFDVMVRRVHAEATLAGRYTLPAADVQPNVWLPAKETTVVTAPATIPWPLVPGLLAATLGNEYVTYRVKGFADVSATRAIGLQVNNQPLDEQGRVPRELVLRAARTSIPGAR